MVIRRLVIALVAALLALAGWYALVVAPHNGRNAPPRASAATPAPIISVSPMPVATPAPTPTPAPAGLRVEVPELSIDLPIVEGDGYNAPLYQAAHYPGTAWPGAGGRTVLYAHARDGMFGPLFRGGVGQHIVIAGPDGSERRYVIAQYFPRWPVTDLSWLRPGDHEQIVLVTCTTYNYNDPRIIAVGEPAS